LREKELRIKKDQVKFGYLFKSTELFFYNLAMDDLQPNNILIYRADDDRLHLEVKLENQTIWLSQKRDALKCAHRIGLDKQDHYSTGPSYSIDPLPFPPVRLRYDNRRWKEVPAPEGPKKCLKDSLLYDIKYVMIEKHKMNKLDKENNYSKLLTDIGDLLSEGRKFAAQRINAALVETYWNIGKSIVEFEQKGQLKAEYGSTLLTQLAKDLKLKYGKGFSKSNIYLMRLFYLKYKKFQTVSGKLGWSKYCELLAIDDDLARSFYEKQCINENWSVRELKRQINTSLFERFALSKDKKGVLELATKGSIIEKPYDLVKDPYVFEFLDFPERDKYSEKDLQSRLVKKLGHFLLELGKGFAFIGQQYRITLNNTHYYVDLVFYHRILKCFVLIDLKRGKVDHQDIGQMNLYLNYFKYEENTEGDTEPVGLVLAAAKDEILVKYATGSISNQLFVSKYQIYLPDKELLEQELRELLGEGYRE
jgi:predicted nuclease of restriction endonuclease-like (RecB) superfamily